MGIVNNLTIQFDINSKQYCFKLEHPKKLNKKSSVDGKCYS